MRGQPRFVANEIALPRLELAIRLLPKPLYILWQEQEATLAQLAPGAQMRHDVAL